ncbi:MAG: acyl-CoA reductase [Lachnospiraceae bacterium]|nr:acyl-CoA reductase [Lachnospiraceae bacterium]
MILLHGEVIESNIEQKYLNGLYEDCIKTLSNAEPITAEMVISACDALYRKAMRGEYDEIVLPLLQLSDISYERFQTMAALFSREELEYKCAVELGEDCEMKPLKSGIHRKRYPLGILFHIAAGNVDGLPAYSVIEGLLTGNINILKLPAGDNGLSIKLLSELIRFEPALKDYVYVFDVPSTETETLKKFAEIADGIVVWGGDEAVAAARSMADVQTRIIAWGHKLSFAYVTEQASEEDLYRLALHICETNQVLCSSCQGIFVDTEDWTVLESFGEQFFELLKKANAEKGKADMGMRGRNTIRLYNDLLENHQDRKIFSAEGVSVVIRQDSELELSYLFRNVWIKALPRRKMIETIKKHKNHLQTCGLLCGEAERAELAGLLARAGIVRITGSDMSRMVAGEAHDGTYPLWEYSRIVELDG